MFKCAVLTISDRCSKKESEDETGEVIRRMVSIAGAELVFSGIVPDEKDLIKLKLIECCSDVGADVVLTCGGTGLGPRDVTPEATAEVLDKPIPGIAELMRMEGLKKTKNTALSRGVSGLKGRTLIINLPGSPKGAEESLLPVMDIIPHALDMVRGKGH